MTTLAAIDDGAGTIWLGSDGQATCDHLIEQTAFPKWLVRDDWALGVAGEPSVLGVAARLETALFQGAEPFAESLRAALSELGWTPACENGESPHRRVEALLACDSGLWLLDLGMGWPMKVPAGRMVACGSGKALALGADHAVAEKDPPERICAAIRAGIELDVYSGGRPWICAFVPGGK